MSPLLAGMTEVHQIWHAFPLIIVISLVYAATRHEINAHIVSHAVRLGAWITGFLATVLGVLFVISAML